MRIVWRSKMKRTAVLAALMIGTALSAHAQQQAPSTVPPAETETVVPKTNSGAAETPANRTDQTARTPALTPASWSVKERLNAGVYNPSGERIGDVNDIIVDDSNKITSLIIGVGGFLGIGEKEVAVSPSEVKSAMQKDGKAHFVLNATKESLQSAPAFVQPRG